MRSMNPEINYAATIYDVAVDGGGTSGAITPAISSQIPDNALIVSIVVDTLTAFVGTGNTLKVTVGGKDLTSAMTIAERSVTDTLCYISKSSKVCWRYYYHSNECNCNCNCREMCYYCRILYTCGIIRKNKRKQQIT